MKDKKSLPGISGKEFKIRVEKAWGDNNPLPEEVRLKVEKINISWWKKLLQKIGFNSSFFCTIKKYD